MSHKSNRKLQNLNARIALLTVYAAGNDLHTARDTAVREVADGRIKQFPTYTQARKFLKTIPREVRERYEKEIRAEHNEAAALLEKQRVALRSTNIPTENHVERARRKDRKKGGAK